MQIFELDGYLRLRSDYMHQFFLGQGYYAAANTNIPNVNYGLPPFPVPLDCPRPSEGSGLQPSMIPSNCASKNIGGANLRFRLEPTLNVTDRSACTRRSTSSTTRSWARRRIRWPASRATTARLDGHAAGPARRRAVAASCTRPRIRPRSARTASCPASAPSAPGRRSTPSSDRSASAACPGTGAAACSTTRAACADCDVGTTVDRVMGLTTIYGHQIAAGVGPRRAGPDDPAADRWDATIRAATRTTCRRTTTCCS